MSCTQPSGKNTHNESQTDFSWVCDLYHLGQMVAREPSSDLALRKILQHITFKLGARTGCLALRESSDKVLMISAGIGLPEGVAGTTVPFGEGVLGWVAEHGTPLLLNGDASSDPRFKQTIKRDPKRRPHSAMCWPLISENRVIGVISLNRDPEAPSFTQLDMDHAEIMVSHVTVVIENARLHRSHSRQMASLAQANVRIALLSEVQAKFLQVDNHIGPDGDLLPFLREVLDDIATITGVPYSAIVTFDVTGERDIVVTRGMDADLQQKLGANLCKTGSMEPLLFAETVINTVDLHADAAFAARVPEDCPIKALLGVPLTSGGKSCGILIVADGKDGRAFDDNDELIIGMLANDTALLVERMRLLNELTESHKATATILESITDSFFAIDDNWCLTYINQQAERLLGAARDEILGQNIWDRLPEFSSAFFMQFKKAAKDRGKRDFEGYYPPLDVWLECHVYPAQTGMSVYFRDISERKQREREQQELIEKLREAKEQLLQSEKLASIGQLAAGVAHEINNPVGYISSNIGTLRTYVQDLFRVLDAYVESEPALANDADSMDRVQAVKKAVDLDYLRQDVIDLVNESQEGVKRVRQIVQDLKDFSHVDKGEWENADLHKGLDSTLNIVHNEIKYKADVVKEYGDLPLVECLASQLNQVFMNLLVNAAHAIKEHGTITVRTGMVDDEVWVEVEDTGSGISPENLKKIFDPFFTTKDVGKGTGLGLSLSYGIVKKHGGRIEVDSEIGKGTRFRVWIPRNSQRQGQEVPDEELKEAQAG